MQYSPSPISNSGVGTRSSVSDPTAFKALSRLPGKGIAIAKDITTEEPSVIDKSQSDGCRGGMSSSSYAGDSGKDEAGTGGLGRKYCPKEDIIPDRCRERGSTSFDDEVGSGSIGQNNVAEKG
jgi:hypothetical protein